MEMPIIRALTFDAPGDERDGSWLNFADVLCYMDWLEPLYPQDAKTLDKLKEAFITGMVNRHD